MTLEEILKQDTSDKSLTELIEMLDSDEVDNEHAILQLRLRHEEDTGIPMEEDDFGIQFQMRMHSLAERMFPRIVKRLKEYERTGVLLDSDGNEIEIDDKRASVEDEGTSVEDNGGELPEDFNLREYLEKSLNDSSAVQIWEDDEEEVKRPRKPRRKSGKTAKKANLKSGTKAAKKSAKRAKRSGVGQH
ncbi:MAG: hypothetical protein IJH50_12335 [Kiritimatiellae bacterium]|nr:hypothetical protein [Kiritimatiellia bacterium]